MIRSCESPFRLCASVTGWCMSSSTHVAPAAIIFRSTPGSDVSSITMGSVAWDVNKDTEGFWTKSVGTQTSSKNPILVKENAEWKTLPLIVHYTYPTGCPPKKWLIVYMKSNIVPQIWRFKRPGFGQKCWMWRKILDFINSTFFGIPSTYNLSATNACVFSSSPLFC